MIVWHLSNFIRYTLFVRPSAAARAKITKKEESEPSSDQGTAVEVTSPTAGAAAAPPTQRKSTSRKRASSQVKESDTPNKQEPSGKKKRSTARKTRGKSDAHNVVSHSLANSPNLN